jgi:hypothetical protein
VHIVSYHWALTRWTAFKPSYTEDKLRLYFQSNHLRSGSKNLLSATDTWLHDEDKYWLFNNAGETGVLTDTEYVDTTIHIDRTTHGGEYWQTDSSVHYILLINQQLYP